MYSFKNMQTWSTGIPGNDFTNHDEDIYVGYRFFDTFGKAVAYPFGFGLSYTTFSHKGLKVKTLKNGDLEVTVTIKNTGKTTGKEVSQIYVSAPEGSILKPAKELKAFAKTRELRPGESQTLTMTIQKRDLASFDEANSQWLIEGGSYTVMAASNSRDVIEKTTVKVTPWSEKVSNALAPTVELDLLKP